jgi:HEAT repeat protein
MTMATTDYEALVAKLLRMGDAREMRHWPNYRALGLGPEHVPDLIRVALDEELNRGDSESDAIWAPVHAWRALGQLGAEEAAGPLIQTLHWIDDYNDDWVAEELPDVFGLIGAAAIAPVVRYLADDDQGLWGRIAAARGLVEIGERHPETRSDCVAALMAVLDVLRGLEIDEFAVTAEPERQ